MGLFFKNPMIPHPLRRQPGSTLKASAAISVLAIFEAKLTADLKQACRSAIYLSRAPYEPSVGVQLLAVLRSMFTKNRTEITSEQVVQEFVADPDSPWQEYRGRGPITKDQVAALLRDYDIRPVVVHPNTRRASALRMRSGEVGIFRSTALITKAKWSSAVS